MASSPWSRKKCAQNFGLWTAVNKTIREEYMRQLACLSMSVNVLVANKALVPLRRLLRLRILDISGKLGNSPETHESDPDRIAMSLCHDVMGLPSHPLHVQHKETIVDNWHLRRQWHSYLPFRACLASPRSICMVSGSGQGASSNGMDVLQSCRWAGLVWRLCDEQILHNANHRHTGGSQCMTVQVIIM